MGRRSLGVARLHRAARSPWTLLVLICGALNVTETLLVMAFAQGTRPELASQASAVAPFGVLHDLRWISVYHDSWLSFGAEVLAMVVLRGLLTGASVALAWPRHVPRPSGARLAARGLWATLLSAALLAPSVTVLFAMAVVPVSWLFFAAVPTALIVALVIHPVASDGRWWRHSLPLRGIGWIALSFLVMTATSVVMNHVPAPAWPVITATAGLFNAWAWVGVVHAVVDREPRAVVPIAPLGLAALAATLVFGTVAGFGRVDNPRTAPMTVDAAGRGGSGGTLLVVSGYGSRWDGTPRHTIPGNFREVTFSYKGLGWSGEPLPYSRADTVKSLPELDRMFAEQVEALHLSSGADVEVIAESEGALVAKTALLHDPGLPVATLVMASPLLEPGRVSYPPPGSAGWGMATGAGMQLLSAAVQGLAPIDLSPASPLLRSLDRAGPSLGSVLSCRIPGVRQFALLPLADAVADPVPTPLAYPSIVVASFHGGLLEDPSDARLVAKIIGHASVGDNQLLRVADEAIRSGAAAWLAPSLVASGRSTGPAAETSVAGCHG